MKLRPIQIIALAAGAALTLGACSAASAGTPASTSTAQLRKVTLVLDWTPNTNHTGLYVAAEKGYFADHGLDVTFIQPPDTGSDALVASGKAEFGVSYQENVTQARGQDVPVVSIAAVLAHNTSGFASPVDRGITRPRQYEGHVYGGWGSPIEGAILNSLVAEDGGDPTKVTNINIGTTSVISAFAHDIDLGWIYGGWDAVQAKQQGINLSIQYLRDYDPALDWYTPVLTTSENLVAKDPTLVKDFVDAARQGYEYTIAHPAEAGDILVKAVPDLDPALVSASLVYLAPQFQADSPVWGYQRDVVWKDFSGWLEKNQIIKPGFDYAAAYTNTFTGTGS